MEINKEYALKAIAGDRSALFTAFIWVDTPQGYEYWSRQCRGDDPIDVDTLRAMIGDDNRITVGNTYTDRNGNKYECLFVRDGKAWMTSNGVTAYVWDANTGDAICLGSIGGDYSIVFHERRKGSVEYVNGVPQWDTWQEDE